MVFPAKLGAFVFGPLEDADARRFLALKMVPGFIVTVGQNRFVTSFAESYGQFLLHFRFIDFIDSYQHLHD